MTEPNAAEKKILLEFRNRVSDVLKTEEQKEDHYLIRWLRGVAIARDLDLQKAEDMLRTSLRWREENGINHVLQIELDPFFKKEFPYYIIGHDKKSQPVGFVQIGKWDFRKVTTNEWKDGFKIYLEQSYEKISNSIKNRNKSRDPKLYPITQFTVVMDWSNYSYMQWINFKAVQAMLEMGISFESHYPELLYRGYFLNCPPFFNLCWAVFKTVIAPATLNKITVLGCNKDEWVQTLREDIDDDQLSIILNVMS